MTEQELRAYVMAQLGVRTIPEEVSVDWQGCLDLWEGFGLDVRADLVDVVRGEMVREAVARAMRAMSERLAAWVASPAGEIMLRIALERAHEDPTALWRRYGWLAEGE
jgi:hypothetical protein